MKGRFLTIFVSLLVLAGCKGRSRQEVAASFPVVMPPAMMEDVQDRADYVALHFWDSFADPSREYSRDTSLCGGVRHTEVEQKFADWTACLGMVSFGTASKAVSNLYSKVAACERKDSSSNIFETINELIYKYLYDPNSPVRNEDLYGLYAEKLAGCEFIDPARRDAYSFDAKMCSLNRVGTRASDFRFSDSRGRIANLYGIEADWILLFFSNPGCEACMEIINSIKSSRNIEAMLSCGELAVLNIYIDEDLEAWRSYMPIYPKEWYNGFDPDFIIRTDILYNVRAIPSLYVLDKDKIVVMKDAVPERVFAFFENLMQ
ncbi:MAG: DUF5106 domain-containing protein [Candidatus Cryptobacteroides sp.]